MQSRMIGMAVAAFAGAAMASASWAADDATFLKDAIQGSLAEVKMGQLAEKNGESEEVRSFGTKLVTDHSASMDQAAELAQSIGAPVPDQPKPEAQQHYEQLEKLTGAEFDAAFAEHMAMDHEKEIQKFEEQSQAGSGEVAEFAKATLPTLQQHLEIAESIAKK
jgi:putative membrane protein